MKKALRRAPGESPRYPTLVAARRKRWVVLASLGAAALAVSGPACTGGTPPGEGRSYDEDPWAGELPDAGPVMDGGSSDGGSTDGGPTDGGSTGGGDH